MHQSPLISAQGCLSFPACDDPICRAVNHWECVDFFNHHLVCECNLARREWIEQNGAHLRKIIDCGLLLLGSIYTTCTAHKTKSILYAKHHPTHHLFQPLSFGKHCVSAVRRRCAKFKNSFYLTAIIYYVKLHDFLIWLCFIIAFC